MATQEKVQITDEFSLVKRERSPFWYLLWYDRGQKCRRSTGTSELEGPAGAFVRAREMILEQFSISPDQTQDVRISDIVDAYRIQVGEKLASRSTIRVASKIWREYWGDTVAKDFTLRRQDQFIKWMRAKGFSEGYVRRTLGAGFAAIKRAIRYGELTTPVSFQPLPAEPEPFPHYATRAQLVAFLNQPMPESMWSYCLIRLNTSCRGDAARELGWGQIDFEMKLVYLNPPGRMQTKKYRSVVPLSATLSNYLEGIPDAARAPTIVHENGRAYKKNLRETWKKHRLNAKLPAWFIPKVLRHTVATELRRRGVNEWEASGLMGHRTAGTTERYAKFNPEYLGMARQAIDAWMEDLARDVPRLKSLIRATDGPLMIENAENENEKPVVA